MKHAWLERLRDAIADRGRELLKLGQPDDPRRRPEALCRALLEGQGEASSVALSREVLRDYAGMDEDQRLEFFRMLAEDFSPSPEAIEQATRRYLESRGDTELLQLFAVVEPPRQELFRRLNMAPQGTAALVRMRGDLLGMLRAHPELKAVDADLRHLLGSWFNRGFLQMRAITWQTPADVLEKLIHYEAVHAIRGWNDLRRRLAEDRRCFAFFHPAMPQEPLIFVEVALVQGMTRQVQPLLDPQAPILDPASADTAMFYSINNTQAGLRGISFGNFLLKQVVEELRVEFPGLEQFATLSPMPRFAAALRGALEGKAEGIDQAPLEKVLEEHGDQLAEAAGTDEPRQALLHLLGAPLEHQDALREPLEQLALAYLVQRSGRGLLDPVAAFHLANGARLEAINPFADTSDRGLRNAFGVMVNYRYEPEQVEANHERFVSEGVIAMSRPLSRARKRLALEAA